MSCSQADAAGYRKELQDALDQGYARLIIEG
jgi:hypothetical protein